MIWIRLLALMLVVFTTVPLITYSPKRLLAISNQSQDELSNSLFTTTSMTFVFYTLLVVSVRRNFHFLVPFLLRVNRFFVS